MITHLQDVMQKHESENQEMAEKLVLMKNQMYSSDDDTFKRKYAVTRISKMGNSEGILNFSSETCLTNSNETEPYITVEYGAKGDAIKLAIRKLDDFYITDKREVVLTWKSKSRMFGSSRTEAFISEECEEIIDTLVHLKERVDHEEGKND